MSVDLLSSKQHCSANLTQPRQVTTITHAQAARFSRQLRRFGGSGMDLAGAVSRAMCLSAGADRRAEWFCTSGQMDTDRLHRFP